MTSRRRFSRLVVMVLLGGMAAGAAYFFSIKEPEYRGKTASAWFEVYVSDAGSRTFVFPTVLHRPSLGGRPSSQRPEESALQALLVLGPKAVPALTRPLRTGPFDSPTYARLLVRMPPEIWDRVEGAIPNPAERSSRRRLALEILARLGPQAKDAVPTLLNLLRSTNGLQSTRYFSAIRMPGTPAARQFLRLSALSGESLRDSVIETLVAIHEVPGALMPLLSELGRQRRYGDLVDIASAGRCQDRALVPWLGAALGDSDPAVRQKAMRLIENEGNGASAVLDQVLAALEDSDGDVRWLAARALEASGARQPSVQTALRTASNDTNVLVRTVALRALSKLPQAPVASAERAGTSE